MFMLKWYGFLGLLLIAFGELNIFILKLEPLYSWNYVFFWFGFILLIDSIVYKLQKNSMLMNRRKHFFIALIASIIFWWILEGFNYFVQNWYYVNVPEPQIIAFSVAFSTVIPAVLESTELLKALKIFDKVTIKLKNVKNLPLIFATLAAITFILPLLYPQHFFGLIWFTLFFVFDSLNYKQGTPSIIAELKKGSSLPVYLAFGALFTGFFWEFWNFLSHAKWIYTIPFVTGYFPQLFEMPIIGYLGYLPFGLEVFAFFNFIKLVVKRSGVAGI